MAPVRWLEGRLDVRCYVFLKALIRADCRCAKGLGNQEWLAGLFHAGRWVGI